jgi:dTDP-4-amino-4,6-dideoxy-D-galactose acyltransferase
MTDERLAAIDNWCRKHDISCLYFLAADDPETTYTAERGGFFYTDARITLRQELGKAPTPADPIRHAQSRDREQLRAIARVSHETTRFYHDPHLPDDRCGEVYAEWIGSSCDGGADAVLVADEGGRAVGYVTCGLEGGAVGHIGLIAVAPESRGRGLGAVLVDAAFAWFVDAGATESVVVTQSRNVAGLRLFERAGYVIDSTQLWFHKWYDR